MLSLRLAALIALTAALVMTFGPRLAGAAQAEQIEEFAIAGWSGGAYVDGQTGGFSHCAVSAEYNSDIVLSFHVGAFGLDLVLGKRTWRLPEGEVYDLTLGVDGRWSRTVEAVVVGDHYLRVEIGRDPEAVRMLKNGHLLQIEAAHDSFGFQLEGTKRAITLLERCLERHRYAGSLNPFGGSGPEPQAPANPFAERPERPQDETWSLRDFAVSRGALRDFLVTATGGSRVELAASDAGDAYIDFAVEGIPGTYFEIPTDQRTPAAPQAFHVLTGYLAPDCRGEPTAEAIEGVENSKLQIVRGIYACELPVVYHAIVVVSEAGLDSFLVLEAPAGRRGAVEALGRKLYTALAGRGDSFQGVSLRY